MQTSKSFQEDLKEGKSDNTADYYESIKKSKAASLKLSESIDVKHAIPSSVDVSRDLSSISPLYMASEVEELAQKMDGVVIKSSAFGRRWILWGMHPDTSKYWDDRLQPIIHVDNSEQLTTAIKGIPPLHLLHPRTDYYFFKDGIKPVWSDESNLHGGRWLISLVVPRVESVEELSNRIRRLNAYWNRLMVALAEDSFGCYRDYICGGVLIVKKFKCVVSIWMRQTDSDETILGVGKIFKKMLKVPEEERVDYEEHPKSELNRLINPVLMVYGLSLEYFNCDKVFNLFCLYGNCMKVKFLSLASNTCMVEMESPEDAFNVKKYLTGCRAFGNSLSLTYSYQQSLRQYNSRDCYTLPDHTPSFKDFSESGLLRFDDGEHASKLDLASPARVLAFRGLPANIDEQSVLQIFENKLRYPDRITFTCTKDDRQKSGTVHFATTDEAIEAVVTCNHASFVQSYEKSCNDVGGVLLLSFAAPTDDVEGNFT